MIPNFSEFAHVEAVIHFQLYRIEPEFTFIVSRLHMNMSWLASLVAEEEESVASDSQNGRHGGVFRKFALRCQPRDIRPPLAKSVFEGSLRLPPRIVPRRPCNAQADFDVL